MTYQELVVVGTVGGEHVHVPHHVVSTQIVSLRLSQAREIGFNFEFLRERSYDASLLFIFCEHPAMILSNRA